MREGQLVKTGRTAHYVRESGTGTPLVLLHGWPESSYCWHAVVPLLDAGLRVICPDLRGLGDSARDGDVSDYTKQALAHDILALLTEMGVDQFALAGHDWGGAVAQEMALAAPERITRLALLNIMLVNNPVGYAAANKVHAARLYKAYWYQYFMQTPGLAETMVPGNEATFLRVFLRGRDRNWRFPEAAVREYVRCYQIPGTPASGANYYRAMRADAKQWQTYAERKFEMPVMLVYGTSDPVVVPEFLTGYEDCFDEVSLVEVEASHFVQEEQPEAVAKAFNLHFANAG